MTPMLYYETNKSRQQDLIREADHERLVKQALANQHTALDRAQTNLGRFLVKLGGRLQEVTKPREEALNQNSH
jgi:histone H3/H4